MWSSLVEIEKILLGEGEDVELGARTSKHILVFAFDYPSTLLLFISCAVIISHLYTCLILCLYLY